MMYWSTFLVFVGIANAFNLPFSLPFLAQNSQTPHPSPPEASHDPHKAIAIIGAGAGGSSAAFFISKAKERYGLDLNVHVYEKSSYVGGRSTTVYPYDDPTLGYIELGASIFVKANKNMWRASEEFNLSRKDFDDDDDVTGIWDGEKFIVTMGDSRFKWWDNVKMVWRYGYFALRRMESTVQSMIKTILSLYSSESPSWDSIEALTSAMNWTETVSHTASDYFQSIGISANLVGEVIDAATRVNYGQDIDKIHGLEGAISLAAVGASRIIDGNWRVFERFLNVSGATLSLNSTVKSIKWNENTSTWTVKDSNGSLDYKAIVLAAPFHSSGISIPGSLSSLIPEQPYIHLHVTLLSTMSQYPNSAYFGLSPTDKVPTTVLTSSQGARNGGPEPEFNSLSLDGTISRGGQQEYIFKLFSKQRLSDEWLANMFSNQVGWLLRKEWDAYPELPPTTTFPPLRIDKGFFYVNAIEPFISTMETSTLAARNVVDLLLQEEFESGLCVKATNPVVAEQEVLQMPSPPIVEAEDFVLGWDC